MDIFITCRYAKTKNSMMSDYEINFQCMTLDIEEKKPKATRTGKKRRNKKMRT